jgi:hypothetical protein
MGPPRYVGLPRSHEGSRRTIHCSTIKCRARSTLRALLRMAVPPVLSSTLLSGGPGNPGPGQTPKSPMPGHRGLYSRSWQNRDSRFPESGIPAKSGCPISRIPDFTLSLTQPAGWQWYPARYSQVITTDNGLTILLVVTIAWRCGLLSTLRAAWVLVWPTGRRPQGRCIH